MVYIINAFLILFWNYIISDKYKNKKLLLCCLYAVQWIIISGFRSYSVGADTLAYKIHDFDMIQSKSWRYILQQFVLYIRGAEGIKDPGYMLIEKCFQSIFGRNYTGFLVFIACLFTIPMSIWVYRYSDNACMSFMIYSALFYSFFSITGLRQTIASALVIFGGYECMKNNKIVPLILLHIIAFFIHKSSICFIILYFARFVKINIFYWIVVVASSVSCYIFRHRVMEFLGTMMGYESYIDQYKNTGAYTFIFCFSLIFLAALLLYKKMKIDINCKYAIFATSLALFFTPLTFVDPSAMRIVQYFSIFIMILIPKIVNCFKKVDRVVINFVCYVFLFSYIMFKTGDYSFVFWS